MLIYTYLVKFLARVVLLSARANLVLKKIKLIKENGSDNVKKAKQLKTELTGKTKLLQENTKNLSKQLIKLAGIVFLSLIIIFGTIILWFVI